MQNHSKQKNYKITTANSRRTYFITAGEKPKKKMLIYAKRTQFIVLFTPTIRYKNF